MNVQRADVLMVDFPFHDTAHTKPRPAVVFQSDGDNQRLGTTILAMITKSTRLAGREPRHVLIDISTADGQESGLWHLGRLPESLMQLVSDSLRLGLGLEP